MLETEIKKQLNMIQRIEAAVGQIKAQARSQFVDGSAARASAAQVDARTHGCA